jgi:hypothetical protein
LEGFIKDIQDINGCVLSNELVKILPSSKVMQDILKKFLCRLLHGLRSTVPKKTLGISNLFIQLPDGFRSLN